MIEDLESGPPAAVSATGTHVMALAAGAVAIVALVASIASGSTIIPIASIAEGDRTTATVLVTPAPTPEAATPVLATSGQPGLVTSPISGRATYLPLAPRVVRSSSCDEPSPSPMEAVHRMFDQTISGPTAFAKCWTPGRVPESSVIASYIRARVPTSVTTESVVMRVVGGQLIADVQVRAWWPSEAPLGWANGASRFVSLRHQQDGIWTVDAVRDTPTN